MEYSNEVRRQTGTATCTCQSFTIMSLHLIASLVSLHSCLCMTRHFHALFISKCKTIRLARTVV